MNELNGLVLLDNYSKQVIKTNVSILGAKGFKLIDSLSDITDELVEYSKNVVILEGFLQKQSCMSDLKLWQELYGLKYFFVGANPKFLEQMSSIASVFKSDISKLTYDVVQAAIYKDVSFEDKQATSKLSVLQKAKKIMKSISKYNSDEFELAETLLATEDRLSDVRKRLEVSERKYDDLTITCNKALADRELLMTGYKSIVKNALREREMLQQYEAILTKDVYRKIKLNDYVKRPIVLYFKEYEDFLGLDSFVWTLFTVFRIQKQKSVKVLRLFDRSTSRKMLTVPDYYVKLRNEYDMKSVLTNDFICKSGDYTRILDKLLLNDMELDILILIDSKDFNDTVVSSAPIRFNLCRSLEHMQVFHLSEVSTIVNNESAKYYWNEFDIGNLDDNDEFLYLSSQPVIINILKLFELINSSV